MNINDPRVEEQFGALAQTCARDSAPELIASFLRSMLTPADIAARWVLVPRFKPGARNY